MFGSMMEESVFSSEKLFRALPKHIHAQNRAREPCSQNRCAYGSRAATSPSSTCNCSRLKRSKPSAASKAESQAFALLRQQSSGGEGNFPFIQISERIQLVAI